MADQSSLNTQQRQAINHTDGPALVLAGPGCGKTFVITHRIAHLIQEKQVPPSRIAVFTFTKAAALEMKARSVSLCADASFAVFGTFHSIFYRILLSDTRYTGFVILSEKEKNEILTQLLYTQYSDRSLIRQKLPILKNSISYYLNTNICDEHAQQQEEFRALADAYIRECRRRGRFDFDLILAECLRALTDNPVLRCKWQDYFDYLLVDEFQDTNIIQMQSLAILAEKLHNLFVVGDDDQSIYRFRGADPSVMLRFSEQYQGAAIYPLFENFRSSRQVLDFAARSIAHNEKRFKKKLYGRREVEGEVQILTAESGEEELEEVLCRIKRLMAGGKDCPSVAVLCRTGSRFPLLQAKLQKCGIPCRVKRETEPFYGQEPVRDVLSYLKFAFEGQKRGDLLPVLNRPQRSLSSMFFEDSMVDLSEVLCRYQRAWNRGGAQEILQKNGNLHAALLSESGISRQICRNSFANEMQLQGKRGVEDVRMQGSGNDSFMWMQGKRNHLPLPEWDHDRYARDNEVQRQLEKLRRDVEELRGLDSYGCVCYILHVVGYERWYLAGHSEPERTRARELWEELKCQARISPNVGEWLRELEEAREDVEIPGIRSENEGIALHLMTYHGSKGLEFDHVFLPFVNDRIVPHSKAQTPEEIEEERRMFYVAMTRARDTLTISCVDSGQLKPSPFVLELCRQSGQDMTLKR